MSTRPTTVSFLALTALLALPGARAEQYESLPAAVTRSVQFVTAAWGRTVPVVGVEGESLGTLHDLVIERSSGDVVSLVIAQPSTHSAPKKLRLVSTEHIRWSASADGHRVSLNTEQLEGEPEFDPGKLEIVESRRVIDALDLSEASIAVQASHASDDGNGVGEGESHIRDGKPVRFLLASLLPRQPVSAADDALGEVAGLILESDDAGGGSTVAFVSVRPIQPLQARTSVPSQPAVAGPAVEGASCESNLSDSRCDSLVIPWRTFRPRRGRAFHLVDGFDAREVAPVLPQGRAKALEDRAFRMEIYRFFDVEPRGFDIELEAATSG